jgi:hypothetical protein
MNFREVNKGSRIIRLVGLIHERSSLSASAASSILYELVHWKPDVFLVETGKKSLELSKFVWEHKGPTCSPVQYCHEESCNNEAYAIAACHQMGTSHVPIFPVDVEPFKTRLKLAKSALMHPLDALRLISRYNGNLRKLTNGVANSSVLVLTRSTSSSRSENTTCSRKSTGTLADFLEQQSLWVYLTWTQFTTDLDSS